jgi:hypothetical protein
MLLETAVQLEHNDHFHYGVTEYRLCAEYSELAEHADALS